METLKTIPLIVVTEKMIILKERGISRGSTEPQMFLVTAHKVN